MTQDRIATPKRLSMKLVSVFVLLIFAAAGAIAQSGTDPLKSGFDNPPEGARPRVWWHWMNGNITKEGIKLDLEWMHRVGLGGFQNFDAALATPQVVEKRLAYMTPEWKDAFKYATTLADNLARKRQLQVLRAGARPAAPGCRLAGHEEVCVERNARRRRQAVHRNAGSSAVEYRSVPESSRSKTRRAMGIQFNAPQFYADSAVVAYRGPDSDVPPNQLQFKVTLERRND